ncbi:related to tRNA ligase [Claviceps purpurea 20.1]|uniref:tRNA ligase n=1 Tax=Claviceps purpurea (strain 20.1) TaxID=1111077 RepID=M1W7B4_CLAP2|nr:related to tRNA ligase [Claviceps purpurea 20.1]
MATAPYVSQDVAEVARMLSALELARQNKHRGGFTVRKSTFDVQSSTDSVKVDSWKMRDWDYKRRDLPTYARGLFTVPQTDRQQPQIAIRGYDKFFNVDEVHETTWKNIMSNTRPPYELTLKENGCIIFLSGLEDGTLLVCSKHSTGERDGIQVSHSSAGERHLERQLAKLGKTKSDLAKELRSRNATAVAELCDDEFEEHVLAYDTGRAGLYLHGINLNLPDFVTYPSSFVQTFADDWGFIRTGLRVLDDVQEVKDFLEEVAQTGSHEGREVEGFVIRCKRSTDPTSRPFQDWFFKFKFEEPYLMYRQWRECTRSLIAGKQPKFKKHKSLTEEYLIYARKRLTADPSLGELYNQNHGIISLRDDFLKSKNLSGYDAALTEDVNPVAIMSQVKEDIIICPIATIGCGKTTLALALTQLFGWGHVQNDNISGKGRPPRFVRAILDDLQNRPVVFADRNNAAKYERRQLITDVKFHNPTAKIVCLNFCHEESSIDNIRSVTRARVLARGDNHQTIHAASDKNRFFDVMDGFINRFEACAPFTNPDSGFDLVIDLDAQADTRQNLETTVSSLHQHFPCLIDKVPLPEQYDAAMESALKYRPTFRHSIPDRNTVKNGNKRLEYISVDVASHELNDVLEKTFGECSSHVSRFYTQLKETRRIQSKFHVTLMHRANSAERNDLWQRYVQAWESSGRSDQPLGRCNLMVERIVFDDRLMTLVVRLLDDAVQWECVNRVSHITVGTRDSTIKPKESNDLLERWIKEGAKDGDITEILLEDQPVLQGVVKGNPSR